MYGSGRLCFVRLGNVVIQTRLGVLEQARGRAIAGLLGLGRGCGLCIGGGLGVGFVRSLVFLLRIRKQRSQPAIADQTTVGNRGGIRALGDSHMIVLAHQGGIAGLLVARLGAGLDNGLERLQVAAVLLH